MRIVPSVHSNCTLIILCLFILSLGMNGCGKMPINGDLDGQWQVMEVRNGEEQVVFPTGKRFYFNFYLHVCQLGTEDNRPAGLVANMVYEDDVLSLDFPYVKSGEVDALWMGRLKYWGVPQSGQVTYKILLISSSVLEMKAGDVVVYCRKF